MTLPRKLGVNPIRMQDRPQVVAGLARVDQAGAPFVAEGVGQRRGHAERMSQMFLRVSRS